MGTPNSSVWGLETGEQLRNSEHPEERELYAAASQLIDELTKNLEPILRHISAPRDYFTSSAARDKRELSELKRTKAITVAFDHLLSRELVLSSTGDFLLLNVDMPATPRVNRNDRDYTKIYQGPAAWGSLLLSHVIAGLQKALSDAVTRREGFLEDIKSRKDVLDRMMDVLNTH